MNSLFSKFMILSAAMLALSCASTPSAEPNRVIAQSGDSSKLAAQEKIFQDSWASATPAGDFIKQVDRMVSLYLRAQKFMMDFDSELEGDLNALNRSESYRKLQVIRAMQEDQVEQVAFLYGRFIDMQQSGDVAAVKKAGTVLSAFGRYMLLNRNKLNRLAMQDVVRELRAVRSERGQKKSSELDGMEFTSAEEIVSFLGEKEGITGRREALATAAKKEATQVDAEFDEAFVASEKAEVKASREPQSQVSYFPNAGRPGNLMGHELPMGTYAVTFDDGPHAQWTPKVLELMEETGFRTSFFWLAKNLVSHRMDAIVQAAKQAGHTLGNHSYSHADLSKSTADIEKEVNVSTAIDKEVYGMKPSYFRCPYGSCLYKNTERTREAIAEQRMLHVTWTIDSLDWQDKDPQVIYERVLKQVKRNGRGIILFHDIHPQSYAAAALLMREYFAKNKRDLKVLTVSQVVRDLNALPPQEMPPILKWLPWAK